MDEGGSGEVGVEGGVGRGRRRSLGGLASGFPLVSNKYKTKTVVLYK